MIFSAVPSCPSRIVGLVYYPSTLAPDFGTKDDHKYRQTSKSSPHTQSVDLPRSLFDAHSPRQPSASPASPAFSAPESYFTMHASYLIICPRFTLGVAAVTEKNGGQTEGHTHTHTQLDRPTAITLRCACAQARVN